MKIGFDLRTIAEGKRTGVEEYTLNILREIIKDEADSFYLFYNAFFKSEALQNISFPENVFLKKFDVPNKGLDLFFFLGFPKADKILGGTDVFFSPHFFSLPISKDSKKVTTFHDLSFLHYPEFFPFKKKVWHFVQNPKKQAESSDKIIAVSESTKKDLMKFYNIPKEKIEVVYSGVDHSFKKLQKDDPNLKRVREKYKLPENFIFFLGTIEPRKNIEGIIDAFEKIRETKKIKLVIAGMLGWLFSDIMKKKENSRFKDDIIFCGAVDQKDKVYLYNLASVFVYPSFFEGFGFPPLEAMASGTPVVTSNNSSLPEIVGDAGIMVDPYKTSEIADAIRMILESESLSRKLSEKGIMQAKKFSWEEAGRKTLNIIKNI